MTWLHAHDGSLINLEHAASIVSQDDEGGRKAIVARMADGTTATIWSGAAEDLKERLKQVRDALGMKCQVTH